MILRFPQTAKKLHLCGFVGFVPFDAAFSRDQGHAIIDPQCFYALGGAKLNIIQISACLCNGCHVGHSTAGMEVSDYGRVRIWSGRWPVEWSGN